MRRSSESFRPPRGMTDPDLAADRPRRPAPLEHGRPGEAAIRWSGLGIAVLLVVLAIVLPRILGWDVHVGGVPPLLADWRPHVGPGTGPAVVIAALVILLGGVAADRVAWRLLLLGSFVVALAWIVSLATVDGLTGISHVLEWRSEYLRPARQVTGVGALLHGFIARIPLTAPGHWPVHVAGHPPGALLFFVLLVRLGLGSGLASGLVVITIAATIPAAVLITLRRLGAEAAARRVAPILAVGPSAVWLGVSADAMFAAVAAWGLCCLAGAATAGNPWLRTGLAVPAGLLLGSCALLSYGLPLLGVLALAVLLVARSWRPLPVAALAAVAVVLAFAAGGFVWWDAYPVLVHRYWAGFAAVRPAAYWSWADLAVLALSAGPVVGPGVAAALLGRRMPSTRGDRAVVCLTVAAVVIVALADASSLSKAEVERIWLPFVPWLLLGTALLPARWRRWGLAGNVVLALAIEHLLHTAW